MAPPQKRRALVQAGPHGNPPPNVLSRCQKTFAKAATFADLVTLVRDAERRLIAGLGITSVEDRVNTLRGLFYGTDWSADYIVEKSQVRNAGFTVFAGACRVDPRPVLKCNLYQALQGSQDMDDGAARHFDFGHLVIGLDARSSYRTRALSLPGFGGTGLEISTWLGDLGGGAAMLAMARANLPSTPALTRFRGSDYGGSINLEGDVAGFAVAEDGSAEVSAPSYTSGTLADTLAKYVSPAVWMKRADRFLTFYETAFAGAAHVESGLASKIEDFAVFYLSQRLTSHGAFKPAVVRVASRHLAGAAHECAKLFVKALNRSRMGGARIEAAGPGPAVTPPGASNYMLDQAVNLWELRSGLGLFP